MLVMLLSPDDELILKMEVKQPGYVYYMPKLRKPPKLSFNDLYKSTTIEEVKFVVDRYDSVMYSILYGKQVVVYRQEGWERRDFVRT